MKLFISQPMRGKTDDGIKAERERLIEAAKREYGDDIEVLDTFFQGAPGNGSPLAFLGESLKCLAEADVALFAPGWEDACGCRIEHTCAKEYGINVEEAVE